MFDNVLEGQLLPRRSKEYDFKFNTLIILNKKRNNVKKVSLNNIILAHQKWKKKKTEQKQGQVVKWFDLSGR